MLHGEQAWPMPGKFRSTCSPGSLKQQPCVTRQLRAVAAMRLATGAALHAKQIGLRRAELLKIQNLLHLSHPLSIVLTLCLPNPLGDCRSFATWSFAFHE